MTNSTDRRRLDPVNTRQTILTAALDMFAEKGFDGTSIADIAAMAQVPKSLLQYHFGTKEELWKACLEQKAVAALQPLDRFLDNPDAASLAALVEARFRVFQQNPKIARVLAWASMGSAPLPDFLTQRRERMLQIGTREPSQSQLTRLLFALAAMDGWFLYRDLYQRTLGDAVGEETQANNFLQFLLRTMHTSDTDETARRRPMNDTQILIVGAGPTGLALALFLKKAGVTPRIIDKNSGPGQASRAMAVQARTLEFYRQLGFAQDLVDHGITIDSIHLWAHSHLATSVDITDFGEGLSPYPFILSYPQDDHEHLLVRYLQAAGVFVEWNTELLAVCEEDEAVHATLRKPDGTEEQSIYAYVCGCDGARSIVRQDLKLGFAGGTYDKTYFVADVEATGQAAVAHSFNLCLGGQDVLLVLPVRSTGMNRLIGVIPQELHGKADVTFEDIRPHAEAAADLHVQTVNWFSTYRAHHRVAAHFRQGRMFVSGDAGHIHSPVGGQGMNTGIGDAVNLAWKLAAVIQGRADASLLDTYEPERIAFAHSLVATTDKVFQLMTGSGLTSKIMRETVMPHLAPFALGFSGVRTAAYRLVSQVHISYYDSALSDGAAGDLHGGDRLPWVSLANGSDNFAPLQSVDWQIHIYGEATQALQDAAQTASLPLHQFTWTDSMEKSDLKRDALYLIRPDGYVALADADQDIAKLQAYLAKFKILARPAAS